MKRVIHPELMWKFFATIPCFLAIVRARFCIIVEVPCVFKDRLLNLRELAGLRFTESSTCLAGSLKLVVPTSPVSDTNLVDTEVPANSAVAVPERKLNSI